MNVDEYRAPPTSKVGEMQEAVRVLARHGLGRDEILSLVREAISDVRREAKR